MRTHEVIDKLHIPRHKLYYLEQKGYITPIKTPMGDIEAREFASTEVQKIELIWKYLQQGFKHKVAYQKALAELNKQQLSFSDFIEKDN